MTDTLPRTLFIGRGNGGVCWYRCALPATVLGADWVGVTGRPPDLRFVTGVTGPDMSLDALSGYEVVVVQQPIGEEWLQLIRRLQSAGATVLFEVDDYMQAVRKIDSHELKDVFTRDWVRSAELNMRVADGVICSTPWLARRYRAFNPNVWVCPNGIDLARYAYSRPERDHVTIGWAGGVGHIASMRPWLPAVAAVLRARPNARFTTVGAAFADELVAEFGAERCRSLPFAALEVYPASVSTFDIALAPSGNNNLFRGKSDLRWLEASALGIPVVGDPAVYPELEDGVTGMAAATAADAEAAMLALVDDAGRRRAIGAAALAHVTEHRRIEVAAQRWAEVLREAHAAHAVAAA
jgi:glycosyltransferase involved in cell wall biosynthesis